MIDAASVLCLKLPLISLFNLSVNHRSLRKQLLFPRPFSLKAAPQEQGDKGRLQREGGWPRPGQRQSISGPNRIVMASTGQSRRQEPQCQHSSGYLTIGSFFLLSKRITSSGQCKSQVPHFLHFFRSITGGMVCSFLAYFSITGVEYHRNSVS
jgi:energy-converting hydrogenase Eha subunit F